MNTEVKVYKWTFSINAPTESDPFRALPLSVADIGYSDKLLRLDLDQNFTIVPKSLISELESRKGEYAWIDDLLATQSNGGKGE